MNNVKEYREIINNHIEKLILQKISEKELITKKNKIILITDYYLPKKNLRYSSVKGTRKQMSFIAHPRL